MACTRRNRPVAFVTGSNGFLGNAVAKAFVAGGYTVYGLVRRQEECAALYADEIVPIRGNLDDLSFVLQLFAMTTRFDVLVSTTEDLFDYTLHFGNVLNLLRRLAGESMRNHGVRSLVLFTSGCKDYGASPLPSPSAPPSFNEGSRLNPPPILIPRTTLSTTVFNHSGIFDAVVLRPTTLYGGSSSYYGPSFEIAATAVQGSTKTLRITADPTCIMHGTHVADVARAYLMLAEADREVVAGKCYNVSSNRHETVDEVAHALAKEYGLDRVEFVRPPTAATPTKGFDVVGLLFGFSQSVSSERLREEVGWHDRYPLFSEGVGTYRRAYEAAAQRRHSNVERVKAYVRLWNDGGSKSHLGMEGIV